MKPMKLNIQLFAPDVGTIPIILYFKDIVESELPESLIFSFDDEQVTIPISGTVTNYDWNYWDSNTFNSITILSEGYSIIPYQYGNGIVYIDVYKNYSFVKKILEDNTVKSIAPNFSQVATTDEGMFSAPDNDGTSCYFRGAVTNNYVKFANFWWRIIRVNGNGSVRLIYDGTTAHANGASTDRRIGKSVFNTNRYNNAYVGYMYGTPGSTTYEATHANVNNSTIKTMLDDWYESNLSNYTNYIDIGAGFWGDRTLSRGSGTGTSSTDYGARYRLYTNKTPTFERSDKDSDLYTVGESNKGNKALTYPIGLITADEVAYAGGVWDTNNTSYYLYTNGAYWTLSPSYFFRGSAGMFIVYSDGSLSGKYVDDSCDVRPVINLRGDLSVTGTGTSADPYEVSLPAVPITNFNGIELTNIYYNGTEISKMYCNGTLVFEKGPTVYKRRIMVGDNLKNRNIYSDFSENFSNELINYYSGSSNGNIFISPVNSDNTLINKFHDIYGRTPAGDTVRVEFSDEHVFYHLHTDGTVEINNIFNMSSDINYEVGEVVEDSPTYRHLYIEDHKIRPIQVGDKIIEGTQLYFNFPDNPDSWLTGKSSCDVIKCGDKTIMYYVTEQPVSRATSAISSISLESNDIYAFDLNTLEISKNLSSYIIKFYYQDAVSYVDDKFQQYILVDTTTLGA